MAFTRIEIPTQRAVDEHSHKRTYGVESRDSVIHRAGCLKDDTVIDLCGSDEEVAVHDATAPIRKKRRLFHNGNHSIYTSASQNLSTSPKSVDSPFSSSPSESGVELVPASERYKGPVSSITHNGDGCTSELARLLGTSPLGRRSLVATPDRGSTDHISSPMFFSDWADGTQGQFGNNEDTQRCPHVTKQSRHSTLGFQRSVGSGQPRTHRKSELDHIPGYFHDLQIPDSVGGKPRTSRLQRATKFQSSPPDPLKSKSQTSQSNTSAMSDCEDAFSNSAKIAWADPAITKPVRRGLSLLDQLGHTLTAVSYGGSVEVHQNRSSDQFLPQGLLSELTLPKAFETFDSDTKDMVIQRETLRARERDLQALIEVYTAAAQFLSLERTGRAFEQAQKELNEVSLFSDAVLDQELSGKRARARIQNIRDNLNRRVEKNSRRPDATSVNKVLDQLVPSDRMLKLENETNKVKDRLVELRTQRDRATRSRKRFRDDMRNKISASTGTKPMQITKQNPRSMTKGRRQAQYEAYVDRRLNVAQANLARFHQLVNKEDHLDDAGLSHTDLFKDHDAVSEVSEDETGGEPIPTMPVRSGLDTMSSRGSIDTGAVMIGESIPRITTMQDSSERMQEADQPQCHLRGQRPDKILLQQQTSHACASLKVVRSTMSNNKPTFDETEDVLAPSDSCLDDDRDDEIVEAYRYTVKGVFQGYPDRQDGEEYQFAQCWDRAAAIRQFEALVDEIKSHLLRHGDFEHTSRTSLGLPESRLKTGNDDGCLCRIWIDSTLVEPDVKAYEDARLLAKLTDTFVYFVEWEHIISRRCNPDESVGQAAETMPTDVLATPTTSVTAATPDRHETCTTSETDHLKKETATADCGKCFQSTKAVDEDVDESTSCDGETHQSKETAAEIVIEVQASRPKSSAVQPAAQDGLADDSEHFERRSTECEYAAYAGAPSCVRDNSNPIGMPTEPTTQIEASAGVNAFMSTDSDTIVAQTRSDSTTADLFASIAYANRAAKTRFMEWYITQVADLRTVQIMEDDLEDELKRCGDRHCWTQEQDFEIDAEDASEHVRTVDAMKMWIGKRQIRGPIP